MYYTFVYNSFKRFSYGTEKRYGAGNGVIFNVRFTIFFMYSSNVGLFPISDTTEVKESKGKLFQRPVSSVDITSANSLCIMLFTQLQVILTLTLLHLLQGLYYLRFDKAVLDLEVVCL